MNKIISKVKEKDDIIIFFVIFCISIGVTLNMSVLSVDEVWNFQSAYKLYNGYEIYKEFNVIVTPLFFWCTELIFRIFGANLAVFRKAYSSPSDLAPIGSMPENAISALEQSGDSEVSFKIK